MSKLSQLKEWLTLEDTAKELSNSLSEQVNVADVLRLGLDGHLKLSVNFINKAPVRSGAVIPNSEASYKEYEALVDSRSLNNTEKTKVKLLQDEHFSDIEAFELDGNVKLVGGIWDILMVAGAKKDIENKYQGLIGGDFIKKFSVDGVFIEQGGEVCQLLQYFNTQNNSSKESFIQEIQDLHPDQKINEDECLELYENIKVSKQKQAEIRAVRASSKNYFPSGIEQDGGVLVVRASAITAFESKIKETLTERQKAIIEIKASRVVEAEKSNQELLDNSISDLIQELRLTNIDDNEYFLNLHVWRDHLVNELKFIEREGYPNKKDFDDRISCLIFKTKEIDSYLNNLDNEGNEIKKSNLINKSNSELEGGKSNETLIERQKAVAEIKANRTLTSLSVNDVLDSTVSDLLEETRPEDDFSRCFELYVWKDFLEKEGIRVTSSSYADEGRREDRLGLIRKKVKELDWHLADCPPENIPIKHTEITHLEWPSIFHNIQLPDEKNLLEAVKVWEKVSDEKFIDIKGYGCVMLSKSVDQRKCAELEIVEIDKLLNTGLCELLIGYNDFDLEQIPIAYKAMLTGRWNDFISIKSTKAYLASEQDEFMADSFFPRRWVVATQVQALIWYKEFLLDVVKNGVSFRNDESLKGKESSKSPVQEGSDSDIEVFNESTVATATVNKTKLGKPHLSKQSLKRLEDLPKYFKAQETFTKNKEGVYRFTCTVKELLEELNKWEGVRIRQKKVIKVIWNTREMDKKMWNSDERKRICIGNERGKSEASINNFNKKQ